jgi:hypothetical protein
MILAKNIPIHADDFIRRCSTDIRLGRYAKDGDYRELLVTETGKSHAKLLEFLRVNDRRPGKRRLYADADHIIPQSVWPVLMPSELQGKEYVHAVANLFWRAVVENQSLDNRFIQQIRSEQGRVAGQAPSQRQAWAKRWIETFLRTKHDEALVFPGDHIDPSRFHSMEGGPRGTNWMGGH